VQSIVKLIIRRILCGIIVLIFSLPIKMVGNKLQNKIFIAPILLYGL